MTAQTQAANRDRRSGDRLSLDVLAESQIFMGGLVALLGGAAIAARAATTRDELSALRVVGLAEHDVLGGASDGDETVEVKGGVYPFANSGGGDEITAAEVGDPCFLVDDQTVAKTVGNGIRPIAGTVFAVDAGSVWVKVGGRNAPRRLYIPFAISETDTLAGTSAELVSPVAGAVTQLQVIVQKAVTTGGALTASVGATAIDGLSCTVADAATKGTVVTDTPTAGHATCAVAVDGRIQVTPSAAFNIAGAVSGFVEITY